MLHLAGQPAGAIELKLFVAEGVYCLRLKKFKNVKKNFFCFCFFSKLFFFLWATPGP